MNSKGNYTLQKCPLCGNASIDSSCIDYDFAFRKNLEHIAKAEEARAKELSYLGKTLKEIKERLFGNSIGSVQETITLLDLKRACPYDNFSEEMSSKHGTDIIAFVRENGRMLGKISISVKRQRRWNSEFLDQIEKNIRDDNSSWGLLVTTVFPNEALNENIWTTLDGTGRLILMVKPIFAPVAYYAIRQIIIYQSSLKELLESKFNNKEIEKICKNEVEKVNRNSTLPIFSATELRLFKFILPSLAVGVPTVMKIKLHLSTAFSVSEEISSDLFNAF